jgi:N-6 DNA Methylase
VSKPPSWNEIRTNAQQFATRWEGTSDENAESQTFWNEFLGIFGIDRKRVATFEARARRESTGGRGRIDLLWPGTLVAEHKSKGKDLAHAEDQALDYLESIDVKDFPGVVITSDFANIRVRDLGGDNTPYTFPLEKLPEEIDRFGFIAGYQKRKFGDLEEQEANVQAAKLMGGLYEELARTGYEGHDASVLMTRLLFLMFGDDTGMWEKGLFSEFVETRTQPDGSDLGPQLAMLFQVLDKAETSRPGTMDELLRRFPYVNGHLFSDRIDIPAFDKRMRDELVRCTLFDWSKISPAVFGSLFQAVKSKEARRTLGEHYTTEHNILRALAPLFLDDLWEEFQSIRDNANRLERFHDKLAEITVMDPACGCGNFLVIAYRELRRLELATLVRLGELRGSGQLHLDVSVMVRVKLSNFYGIEVEEWPARIAETAMFLVDQQANHELARTFGNAPDRLPIMQAVNITIGNALRIDWESVMPIKDNVLIVGNPPFSGASMMTATQKDDVSAVWAGVRGGGNMDLVSCWHVIAARHIGKCGAKAAFVSTNSITQGQQAPVLGAEWERCGVDIDFAHQTFSWSSEAPGQAAVHCVIIGFSARAAKKNKTLFRYPNIKGEPLSAQVSNINAYLQDAPSVLVTNRSRPLQQDVQVMQKGSQPTDGGHLSDISEEEAAKIRATDPVAAKFLRRLVGAQELINRGSRWCLWLVDAQPAEIRSSPELLTRVAAVKEMRTASTKKKTRDDAAISHLFQENRQPKEQYLAVPRVSSEARRYVPMALFPPDVIANDAVLSVSNASLYTFGMLHSSVFMAWNAAVSGRLKSDYRISAEITYNNFPWPENPKNKDQIEAATQAVLDVREMYPTSSLADLYDPRSMPKDLIEAHLGLDRLVLAAYGLKSDATEADILANLFARYAELTADLLTPEMKAKKRSPR